ncbi:hypothetical protein HY380_01540 [Candidatus Saccharibacteria bacterium]|nr:hypothetical protein [Candidatus Saccharibacteria bacterium]
MSVPAKRLNHSAENAGFLPAIELAEATGHPRDIAITWLAKHFGDYPEARSILEEYRRSNYREPPDIHNMSAFDAWIARSKKYRFIEDEDQDKLFASLDRGVEECLAINGAAIRSLYDLASDELTESELTMLEAAGAYHALVVLNQPLVVDYAAKKFDVTNDNFVDILATGVYGPEGKSGLDIAVKRFDRQKGYKFSTYACWWIRLALQRGLPAIVRPLSFNRPDEDEFVRLNATRQKLEEATGRQPSYQEIAAETKPVRSRSLTRNHVAGLLEAARASSLQEIVLEGDRLGAATERQNLLANPHSPDPYEALVQKLALIGLAGANKTSSVEANSAASNWTAAAEPEMQASREVIEALMANGTSDLRKFVLSALSGCIIPALKGKKVEVPDGREVLYDDLILQPGFGSSQKEDVARLLGFSVKSFSSYCAGIAKCIEDRAKRRGIQPPRVNPDYA